MPKVDKVNVIMLLSQSIKIGTKSGNLQSATIESSYLCSDLVMAQYFNYSNLPNHFIYNLYIMYSRSPEIWNNLSVYSNIRSRFM